MIKNWLIFILFIIMSAPLGQLSAQDRMEMDDTSIVGSRELPKVTYIVPWKSSNIREVGGLGNKGSYEDAMTALDREVFRKELEYFGMLQGAGGESQK